MRRTNYTTDVTRESDGREVTILGWVDEIRDLGGIKFIILRDMRGKAQVTMPKSKMPPALLEKVAPLKREFVIGVKGNVVKMDKAPRGAEIIPSEVEVFSGSEDLPLDVKDKKAANLDVRLDMRILDLRGEEQNAVFRIRAKVVQKMREFTAQRGFIEVQTPKIIGSATEGGAELFPVLYYGKNAFLAQSPQLYKEQLVTVFEKVFEVGPIFRAEEFHTTRHLSESTSVDVEEAFATSEDVMRLAEEMVVYIIKALRDGCGDELKVLKRRLTLPSLPFPRYRYEDVVKELKGKGVKIELGDDFPIPVLRELSKIHKGFYFIVDWPTEIKPFYIMPKEDNPEYSQSFDLMYGWLELASGGTRVHDRALLEKRIGEQGLLVNSFASHLQAFKYGMPPHAGWGLGLERLVMVLTGKKNIREAVLFPRDKTRIAP